MKAKSILFLAVVLALALAVPMAAMAGYWETLPLSREDPCDIQTSENCNTVCPDPGKTDCDEAEKLPASKYDSVAQAFLDAKKATIGCDLKAAVVAAAKEKLAEAQKGTDAEVIKTAEEEVVRAEDIWAKQKTLMAEHVKKFGDFLAAYKAAGGSRTFPNPTQ